MTSVVFTVGVFDLLHRGHVNLLRKMKEDACEGGVVVILHNDRSTWLNKGIVPVQSYERRRNCLMVTGLVDRIYSCNRQSPEKEIRLVARPFKAHDLLFMRGDDWQDFPGRAVLEELGIKIRLIPYTDGASSTLSREEMRKR